MPKKNLKRQAAESFAELQNDVLSQYVAAGTITKKDISAVQNIALDIMPRFVEKNKLEEFVNESEKSYTESTFKKYINNYSEFLDAVEQEFYNSLLLWLTE